MTNRVIKICEICGKEAKENENCPYFEDEDDPNQPHIPKHLNKTMNREIKFRAFIYGVGKMVDVMALNRNGTIYVSQIQVYGKEGEDILLQPVVEGEKVFKLVEFTGLKDRNDKEIYEGDVVKRAIVSNQGSSKPEIGQVVYMKNKTAFVIQFSDCDWLAINSPTTEIIGNIYENSNLLKDD